MVNNASQPCYVEAQLIEYVILSKWSQSLISEGVHAFKVKLTKSEKCISITSLKTSFWQNAIHQNMQISTQ